MNRFDQRGKFYAQKYCFASQTYNNNSYRSLDVLSCEKIKL